jgi:hypothetical protein
MLASLGGTCTLCVQEGDLGEEGGVVTQRAKERIALLATVVVLGGGCMAYAATNYPEGKCGDPVEKDDSLLVEGMWFLGDADEPRDADGMGQWSCNNEKE